MILLSRERERAVVALGVNIGDDTSDACGRRRAESPVSDSIVRWSSSTSYDAAYQVKNCESGAIPSNPVPSMICTEKHQLIMRFSILTRQYSQLARVLPAYAGDNWGDEYGVLLERAKVLESDCESARQSLEEHMNRHGCGN